jgi:hypothetical protein
MASRMQSIPFSFYSNLTDAYLGLELNSHALGISLLASRITYTLSSICISTISIPEMLNTWLTTGVNTKGLSPGASQLLTALNWQMLRAPMTGSGLVWEATMSK